MVGKLQAGRYGLNLAVVDRWPLLTGGRYSEVVVRTGLTVHILKQIDRNYYVFLLETHNSSQN